MICIEGNGCDAHLTWYRYEKNMIRFLGSIFRTKQLYVPLLIIAPAISKVRYRGSTFRPFVRSFVRPSVHNLCQGAYSVAVIAGSMKPCIVIALDTHFKKAP